jgi:hypothetical protein
MESECSQEDVFCWTAAVYWLPHSRRTKSAPRSGDSAYPVSDRQSHLSYEILKREKKKKLKNTLCTPFSQCKSVKKFDLGQLRISLFFIPISLILGFDTKW